MAASKTTLVELQSAYRMSRQKNGKKDYTGNVIDLLVEICRGEARMKKGEAIAGLTQKNPFNGEEKPFDAVKVVKALEKLGIKTEHSYQYGGEVFKMSGWAVEKKAHIMPAPKKKVAVKKPAAKKPAAKKAPSRTR